MPKLALAQQLQEQEFHYKTFHQNLTDKLDHQEITSLNVLGKDFFTLIDHVVTELFIARTDDCFILDLSLQQFLWELQIFTNQFIRKEAGSVLKLRQYCQECLTQLPNQAFYQTFIQQINDAYLDHFFIEESDNAYLV